MSDAVRHLARRENGNDRLLEKIEQIVRRKHRDIRKLLADYHVPVVGTGG